MLRSRTLVLFTAPTMLASLMGEAAAAQEVDVFEPLEPINAKVDQPKATQFTISLEFKPNFTSDLTQRRGDRLQDANAASAFNLKYQDNLAEDIVLSANAGVKWASDFENGDIEDEQSSVLAGLKLNWDRGFRRISPFLRYDFEHLTDDVFGSKVATDHGFAAGADIVLAGSRRCKPGEQPTGYGDGRNGCTGTWPYKIKLIPSIGRIQSDDETRDRFTPRIVGQADFTTVGGVAFTIAADYQRRIFDTSLAGTRVQDRLLASAGVDFAGIAKGGPIEFDRLALGLEWLSVQESGVNDVSRISFLPTLGISFKF